jgi:hypothetical protein
MNNTQDDGPAMAQSFLDEKAREHDARLKALEKQLADGHDPAQIELRAWLTDYLAMMERTYEDPPTVVGLHRATVNRQVGLRIERVRAYLREHP